MEQPHLIAGAAGSDVEAALIGRLGERGQTTAIVGGHDEAEEHHMALVALERVRIAADESAAFHFFGANGGEEFGFDQAGLFFAKQ